MYDDGEFIVKTEELPKVIDYFLSETPMLESFDREEAINLFYDDFEFNSEHCGYVFDNDSIAAFLNRLVKIELDNALIDLVGNGMVSTEKDENGELLLRLTDKGRKYVESEFQEPKEDLSSEEESES